MYIEKKQRNRSDRKRSENASMHLEQNYKIESNINSNIGDIHEP